MSAPEAAAATESGAVDVAALSAEDARREKLKQAGAAYFEKVLAAQQGKVGAGGGGGAAKPLPPREPYDDTFETVGAVVEGSKLYVLGTVYVVSLSGGLVFAKSSLDALAAPALLAFIHFLPLLCALWLLSAHGSFDLRPFSGPAVQGALPSAAITGLQALFLFLSLSRCSVTAVLCWVTIVPHVFSALIDLRLQRTKLQPARLAGMLAGSVATAAALAFENWSGMVGAASLLAWAALELLSQLWAACTQRPHLLVQLLGEQRGEALQAVVEAEAALDAATLAFLRHALPTLPLLVIGLALKEASELVDHELSVPSMTMILLSVATYGLSVISLLLIAEGLAREGRAALAAAGPLGTVVVEAAVHGVASPLAFSGAVVAVIAGMVLRMAAAGAA